jgi:hypothetical protein
MALALQAAEKHNHFVVPNEVRNPSSIETEEKEGSLGEKRTAVPHERSP